MSGERRGILAAAMRFLLWTLTPIYGIVVRNRNRRFDNGQGVAPRCDATVISVGNLTTGGTGKTPLVCFLARHYRAAGVRVAIVSRGYGNEDGGLNDEAEELYQRLPDVPHVQDPDRVEAARVAVEELESELILMDDGFQHRRLPRDLDIVVVDATCPFGYGYLLPRGLLREPISGIARADVAVISRCDAVPTSELDSIEAKLKSFHPELVIVRSSHAPGCLIDSTGQANSIDQLSGAKAFLFCGIGNPKAFRASVETLGAEVVDHVVLPDHARYDRDTIASLDRRIRQCKKAERVICTQKDLVKVKTDRIGGLTLSALQIDLKLDAESESQLKKTLPKVDHSNSVST